ncbi:MAG: DUF488 domain-containing protein [Proteobacteria bacterium]|nr:DUF488 domain-containing protein [Pseudomonadota bacterium]MBS0553578.1 DUF488 domain-containing protein [Pseudomonadota bacterium]
MLPVFTIGHSDHTLEAFLALLAQHRVTALADVRAAPYSRRLPHYSKQALADALKVAGFAYVYLGEQLGGRPSARVRSQMHGAGYAAMAATPAFQEGIARVLQGARRHRIALMCAERDPADCHRALLVGRALGASGVELVHIHADGTAEPHSSFEARLLAAAGRADAGDLFASPSEMLDLAYRRQERRASLEADDEDGQ